MVDHLARGSMKNTANVCQCVNCRTHEYRHFEHTLRSMDIIFGSGLAEGRSRNLNTCIAHRYSSYI